MLRFGNKVYIYMVTIFNYFPPPQEILRYAFKANWLFFKFLLFTGKFGCHFDVWIEWKMNC